jgi:hypothetical protein
MLAVVMTAATKSTAASSMATARISTVTPAPAASSVVASVAATTTTATAGRGWDCVGHCGLDLSELVGDRRRHALCAGDGTEAHQRREQRVFDKVLSGLVAIKTIAR